MKKYRKLIWIAGSILAIPMLLLIVTAFQVDDWSRDLSQNRAETSPDALDERLRSLVLESDTEEAVARIDSIIATLPKWNLTSKERREDCHVIALTRTSGLFRFVDDVTATICPHEDGCVIDVVSQSRVGKGDLGQNPRNIEELFNAIRTTD